MESLRGVKKIEGADCTLLWPDIFTMAINARPADKKHWVSLEVKANEIYRHLHVKTVDILREGGELKVLCQEYVDGALVPVFIVFGRRDAYPWELKGAYSVDRAEYVRHKKTVLYAYLLSQ